jgi:hypothetical protein
VDARAHINVSTGLPVFQTIIVGTLIGFSRLLLLPFSIKQLRNTAALAPHQPRLIELKEELDQAYKAGDNSQCNVSPSSNARCHNATSPTSASTSRPRSPSRPLSDNTITTGDTVTPKKLHPRTSRASRAHHHARPISPLCWRSRPQPMRSGDLSRSLASPWPGPARQTEERASLHPFISPTKPSQPPLRSIKDRKFVQNRCVELRYHFRFFSL